MVITRTAIAVILLGCTSVFCAEIVGTARAIDGDSLIVGGAYVRLCGATSIEAGEARYRRDSTALKALVEGQTVRCVPLGEGTPCDGIANGEDYKRKIAQCFIGDRDLAAEMIRSGGSCAWTAESGDAYRGLGCISDRRQ